MRGRSISIPLILLGLFLLGLVAAEQAGPVALPSTGTTDTFVSVQTESGPVATGIAGAVLLLSGIAIEADLQRRRRPPPPGDHTDKA